MVAENKFARDPRKVQKPEDNTKSMMNLTFFASVSWFLEPAVLKAWAGQDVIRNMSRDAGTVEWLGAEGEDKGRKCMLKLLTEWERKKLTLEPSRRSGGEGGDCVRFICN